MSDCASPGGGSSRAVGTRKRLGEAGGDRLTARAEAGRSYALRADGTTISVRPAGPADYGPVRELHEAMSPENLYFRFFGASRAAAGQEAPRGGRAGRPGPRGAAWL